MHRLDDHLREAYRATHYRFDAPGGGLLLQVDRSSEALRQLLQHAGHHCAAILTACNPGSEQQDEARNQRAQSALLTELQAAGLPCITGRHEDPSGQWPAEAGVLTLGLGCANAQQIARRYGQLAFLWTDATATPRLIETI